MTVATGGTGPYAPVPPSLRAIVNLETATIQQLIGMAAAAAPEDLPRTRPVRVLFLIASGGGSGWYRACLPALMLNRHSRRCHALVSMFASKQLFEWATHVVWQHQLNSDQLIEHFANTARASGLRQYYDLDDNAHEPDLQNPIHYDNMVTLAPQIVEHWVKFVDHVIVSTEPLKRYYDAKFGIAATVVENAVDCAAFTALPGRNFNATRYLWAGGNTHYADLQLVAGPLRQFKKLAGETVKLTCMGFDGYLNVRPLRERLHARGINDVIPFGGKDYVCVDIPWDMKERWVSPQDYPARLARLAQHVGLCPLRATAFDQCKSPLKWLEYSMADMAIIASDVTPYREAIVPGETGLLVENEPGAWFDALERLRLDAPLRRTMACNATSAVRARYNAATRWQEYERLFCD